MDLLVPVNEFADAFVNTNARLEAQYASGMDQIGIRQPHVSRLIGIPLDARFLTQRLGDERDQAVEAYALAAAQIRRFDRAGSGSDGPIERGEDAVQTVGNIGIVALTRDRKSTRLNSSHVAISYAVFC